MSFGVSIGDFAKLYEIASRVYKNCRDSPGEYKALTSEARNLTNALEDIRDKFDIIPDQKKPQLSDVYETCVNVLQDLDKVLLHYNNLDTKTKRAWDRLKWDSDRSRSLRERLTSCVVLLNNFYSSLLHDNQVQILEALTRLELDYRGGHREESIASVEQIASSVASDHDQEAEDAAWTQITRDLEDVGISGQDAVMYREFIIDWFVRAVNEGRFMEQRNEPESFATMPQEFQNALPPGDEYSDPKRAFLHPPPHSTSFSISEKISYQPPTSSSVSSTSDKVEPSSVAESSRFRTIPTSVPALAIESLNTSSLIGSQPDAKVREAHQGDFQKGALVSSRMQEKSPQNTPLDSLPTPKYDLFERARQIVDAWLRRDFKAAGLYIEAQLAAVENGETIQSSTTIIQPDRRVLRHLIGVCASYSGDYEKAKIYFESIFNGVYLTGAHVDAGDIAAARWLGDTCLLLQEPQNTALAWSVAYEGLTTRYGALRGGRILEELLLLDVRLQGIQLLQDSLTSNVDTSTIFKSIRASEKTKLISDILARVKNVRPLPSEHPTLATDYRVKMLLKSLRSQDDWSNIEGFLVQPIISMSTWPLQWDSTFSAVRAIDLQWYMSRPHDSISDSLTQISTVGLGRSKNLHFVTRRGVDWLVQTVREALRTFKIEKVERAKESLIICRLPQTYNGLAYFEGVCIRFRKLQLRSVYGIEITGVQMATRPHSENKYKPVSLHESQGAKHLILIISQFLLTAEDQAKDQEGQGKAKENKAKRIG